MTVTDPAPPRSGAALAAELADFPHVDAWTSTNAPTVDCCLDTRHGPAVVFLTVHGDVCRSYEVCGPCALDLVAPLPMSDLVDAEVYDPAPPAPPAPVPAAVAAFVVRPESGRVVVNERRLTASQARFLATALITAAGRVEAGAR